MELHSGLEMASFGDGVFAAAASTSREPTASMLLLKEDAVVKEPLRRHISSP